MLVTFAIDASAMRETDGDVARTRSSHERLVEAWQKYGVLVLTGPDAKQDPFIMALSKLSSPGLRKLWIEAVRRNRKAVSASFKSPDSIEDAGDLASFRGRLDLLCLESHHAHTLGVPTDQTSVDVLGGVLELCRFDCADRTRSFSAAECSATAPVAEGADVNRVWKERFSRLTKYSKRLVVVDRYCASNLLTRRDGQDGLTRLLQGVAASSPGHQLTIHSATQAGETAKDAADQLSRRLSALEGKGLESVDFYLSADFAFRKVAHYRYVRFDDTVCQLDTGLELLAGTRVYRTVLISTSHISRLGTLATDEGVLRQKSQRFKVL